MDSGSSTSATANLSITIYNGLSLPASSTLPAGYTGIGYNGMYRRIGRQRKLLLHGPDCVPICYRHLGWFEYSIAQPPFGRQLQS